LYLHLPMGASIRGRNSVILICGLLSSIVFTYLDSTIQGLANTASPKSAAPTATAVYFVSPGGADTNPGTFERPFASLERAGQAVRRINHGMQSDIVIYLRGGRYQLQKTLTLDAADSGENGFNVIYQSYQNEAPVLSGGRIVTGWVPDGVRWKAFVGTSLESRQLYVNGHRAVRARSAVSFKKAVKTPRGYTIPNLKIDGWQNISDVEIVSAKQWRLYRCGVQRVSGTSVIMKQPCWGLSQLNRSAAIGAPTWIENALELLDAPGEWYLNRSTGWVYYQPRPGEDGASARVVVPVLERLLSVVGTAVAPVHNVIFRGITFADATWLGPSGADGFSEVQANVFATAGPSQSVNHLIPASVSFEFAHTIALERDEFKRLGGAGLALNHVRNATVGDCDFHDISGNGVEVGNFDQPKNADPRFVTQGVQLHDNVIHDVAVEYEGGVGIWLGYVRGSVIRNNDIGYVPYSGISIGWGWGSLDPTIAGNNLIKANHIHDYMQVLNDGGGIYSLSAQPGNLYTENVIEKGPHSNGGIYLDDGSRYIEISRNVLLKNQRTALIKGRDNSIHDNWWQERYGRDVWFPSQKLCIVPACELNKVRNNRIIDGPGQAPTNVLVRAGPGK
jgi:hypothetical protein